MKSPNVIAGTGTVARVQVTTTTVSDFAISPDDAYVNIQFRQDGDEYRVVGDGSPSVFVAPWLLRGVVGDYEIQYNVPSGDLPNATSDAINTWLDFSSLRNWDAEETGVVASHSVSGTIMIRDAVTLAVLVSQTLNLIATVDL